MIGLGLSLILCFLSSFGIFFFFTAVEIIDEADDQEHRKSDDEKVDNVLDKITDGDMSSSIGTEKVWDINRESGKIEAADEEATDRHHDIVHEGIDDCGERATNCDTNRKINNATTVDEFAKFFEKGAFGNFSNGMDNGSDRRMIEVDFWSGSFSLVI